MEYTYEQQLEALVIAVDLMVQQYGSEHENVMKLQAAHATINELNGGR